MAFATVDDLATWLGYPVDPGEIYRAQQVVDLASAVVTAYTGRTFSRLVDDTLTVSGTWAQTIELPEPPVEAVGSVTLDGEALVVAVDYEWVAGSRTLWRAAGWGGPRVPVVVTYTHGYATAPDDVRTVTVALASRYWANPEVVSGRTLDQQSWQYGRSYHDLTVGERRTLDRYRRTAATVSTW